ncbi:hypothetical protein AA0312_2746 [Acetobacter tropicalis NRIC 0312]|nr:hypothetical protein AA0312_2746 [Acetobacter tropicalis NRIC 0312]
MRRTGYAHGKHLAFRNGVLSVLYGKKTAFPFAQIHKSTTHGGHKGADAGLIHVSYPIRGGRPPQSVVEKSVVLGNGKPKLAGEEGNAENGAHGSQWPG